jgi:hypothetical protein
MLVSAFILLWQLTAVFLVAASVGWVLRFLLPAEMSVFSKAVLILAGGVFLLVLLAQNMVYLGVPVQISAWLILALGILQLCLDRRRLFQGLRALYRDPDMRTLLMVVLATVIFHGIVPVRQGLEWYYGKGHYDQISYVLLAEFLKDEPYRTSENDIGLRPWVLKPVGFVEPAKEANDDSGPALSVIGLKEQRIGQSVLTAAMSVWSGTNAKAGYAATVIFGITMLVVCVYALLRAIGINRFMSSAAALLTGLLPGLTRLSLNGFLSQVCMLFTIPLFAILLQNQRFRGRGFTVFFSLSLAYVVSVYSEFAPIGLAVLVLGVVFVRTDTFRWKRMVLMSSLLLIVLVNPYYLRNLIGFLAQQYYYAASVNFFDHLAPNFLTLRGWSEVVFGSPDSVALALLFDGCTVLLSVLLLVGVFVMARRQRLIFAVIGLPAVAIIIALAVLTAHPAYPAAKIVLSMLSVMICLAFVAIAKIGSNRGDRRITVFKNLFAAAIVVAAAIGSFGYYGGVVEGRDNLKFVREPAFLHVCQELEEVKDQRVLVFESNPLLSAWLCYHARKNQVYFTGRNMGDSSVPAVIAFSLVPDLDKIDFVVTRDRLVNLRSPGVLQLPLSFVDPIGRDEDRNSGQVCYWLGPPVVFRFLVLTPFTATLKFRLAPGPDATTGLPVEYILSDGGGNVSRGKIQDENVHMQRIKLSKGFSSIELVVNFKEGRPRLDPGVPILAKMDQFELNEIDTSLHQ